MMPLKLQLQFLVSLFLFLACLLTIYYSEDTMLNELFKALCLVACVNVLRVLSLNTNTINNKQHEKHKTDVWKIQSGGSQRDAA